MTSNKRFSDSSSQEQNDGVLTQISPRILQNMIWRPSELELAVLKMHFQRNRFPTANEKNEIIRIFQVQFNSQLTQNQLTFWFQNERKRTVKKVHKEVVKGVYKKLKKDDLEILHESFSENNYPSTNEMSEIAQQLNCTFSKVENWYKHFRRAQAKQGNLTLKTKRYFKKDELSFLSNFIDECSHPTIKQLQEIAEKLNCTRLQIRTWFANRRKKLNIKLKNKSKQPKIRHQVSDCDSFLKQTILSSEKQFLPLNQVFDSKNFTSQATNSKPLLSIPINPLALNLRSPALGTNSSDNNILSIKNQLDRNFVQCTNNASNPFWRSSLNESILISSLRINNNMHLNMLNNFTIRNSLSSVALKQQISRLNESILQQMLAQNMTNSNFPTCNITYIVTPTILVMNQASQNNEVTSLKKELK